jgi:hypothetical protein
VSVIVIEFITLDGVVSDSDGSGVRRRAAGRSRNDPFSARMNAVPKLVATRALTDTSAWVRAAR